MKHKPRVVFDTNIYISAIIFGGNPRQCLELAREEKIEIFASKSLFLEIANNLQRKFNWQDEEIKQVIEGLGKFVKIVTPSVKINKIKYSPDNIILECAVECNADFIITGDKKHLLLLRKYQNMPIVSAKEFLDLFLY